MHLTFLTPIEKKYIYIYIYSIKKKQYKNNKDHLKMAVTTKKKKEKKKGGAYTLLEHHGICTERKLMQTTHMQAKI